MTNILVIKHGSLGDIVLAMHPLFSIKKNFKDSKITILTEPKYYTLFKHIPFIDEIKVDERNNFFYFLYFVRLCIWFYQQKFDWVFDLQTSTRTNIYFYFFSIFSNFNWSGIAKNCSHPHLGVKRKTLHTLDRQRKQLELAGIKNEAKVNWNCFKSNISRFKLPKHLYVLVIGGSKHRPQKRWSIKKYIKLIKYLNEINIKPALIGGKEEKEYLLRKEFLKLIYYDLVGKTNFSDLAEIARNAKYIIGNDTGPMHLLTQCSKAKSKKIILFGKDSNPKLCAPVGENVSIIQKLDINNILLKDVIKLID
tara:strand:+ start:140 stop:1063 length:924 start_codon:yes stop_codon:yes gene_type:complete